MKFIRDTFSTFTTQIITVVLGLITSVIVARTLGPTNLGIFSLILLTFSLLSSFGSLGINLSNVYYGGKKEYEWDKLASNSFIVAFSIGAILLVLFFIFYFLEPSFLKSVQFVFILIAAIILPFNILQSYFQNILLGQHKITEYNSVYIINSSLYLALILIVLFFNGNLPGVLIAWSLANLLAAIIPVIFVYKHTGFKLHFRSDIFKRTTKFGLKGYLGNMIQFFNYRIDMYLISFLLLNYANVGYYSIAVALAESLWYLPGAVGTMVFARTPGLTDEERNRSTPKICRNTLFITLVFAIILFIAGKYVILFLYGSKYLPALEPLWALLPGIVALSICKVLSNEIAGRGKPMINTYAAAISLAVNVPLNFILIPQIGIVGSALASTISYTVTTIVVLASFLKLSKSSLSETLILKDQDIKVYKTLILNVIKSLKIRNT